MKKDVIRISGFMLCLLLILSCANKEKKNTVENKGAFLMIQSVSGTAQLAFEGNTVVVERGKEVPTGGRVIVDDGSRVVLSIGVSRIIYVNQQSEFIIEYSTGENTKKAEVSVELINGEILSEYNDVGDESISYALSTPSISFVGNDATFNIEYYSDKKVVIVKSLENKISSFPNEQKPVDIPQCHKLLVNETGKISRIVSVTEKDVENLIKWVGKKKTTEILDKSGCLGMPELEIENRAPVWKSKPKKDCKPGMEFVDKLNAVDPENQQVSYFLLKGPKGMSLSEKNGTLSFKPKKSGTYEIAVSAEDPGGNGTSLNYYLTVLGELNAVLKVPGDVLVNTSFTIDASRSVNGLGKREGLRYRFDCTGNKKWDVPGAGLFGEKSSTTWAYKKPGEYTISVEVQGKDEKKDIALKKIEVVEASEIVLGYSPTTGTVGTEFLLKVKQTKGIRGPKKKMSVRWDLNGDGKWDYPGNGTFVNEPEIKHMWDKPGTYSVTVEYQNVKGEIIKTRSKITVHRGVVIEALKCPDTVNVNEDIIVNCIAKDDMFPIVEYAWDFAGVGMFTKKTKDGKVTFSYKKAGIYTLVCSVTNGQGMHASESKNIVAVNDSTSINAGGPYKVYVNKSLMVKGFAQDKDNMIVAYLWDFDGDKKYDWESKKTGETKHVFMKHGTFTIRFAVKTDDGSISEDVAKVTVINRTPKAFAGEDIFSRKNKKIKLNGSGRDPDNNIVLYEWDFNADGKFDWSSKDTAYTEQAFVNFQTPVLKVTDAAGVFAIDTMKVIICPKYMITIDEGNFCIDEYEYPNKKGKLPLTNITYKQAEKICTSVGKRLCTYEEATIVCKGGKERYNYPYGRKYENDYCNSFGNRHVKNKKSSSGDFPECKTKDGVYDMTGNVAEWVSSGKGDVKYAIGGWWQNGEDRAKCGAFMPLKKNKKFRGVGFRCCK